MRTSIQKVMLAAQPSHKFRTDIQALRGFAVLIVLFYHAKIGGLSAGFLGVDVFFVISGFLITSHVRDTIERGTFSFTDFYFRRAKRLLPAAYVTFLITALLAPFFLASSELNDFRAQMSAAVAFVANIVLWRQSGYFEGEAALKPLLHVWSLSIEEQYYFILPALMFFIPRRFWKRVAFFVFIVSLTLCLFMVHRKATATFYLLPTRGWELAIGSIGALILAGEHLNRLWKIAFWPALAILLVLPFVKIANFHPGPDAILICFATLVIILRRHPLLYGGPVVQGMGWLGDISYSLYLVHWPLFAFLNNVWFGGAGNATPPFPVRLGLLLLSVGLAWALNRYIEEPFRRLDIRLSQKVFIRTVAASLILMIIPAGMTQAIASTKDYAHMRRINQGFGEDCEFKDKFAPVAECRNSEFPEILVWGDSYAMHLVPGLLGINTGAPSIIQATMSSCGPLLGVAPTNALYSQEWAETCIGFNDSVLSYLSDAKSVKTVVLSSPFSMYLEEPNKLLRLDYSDGAYTLQEVSEAVAIAGLKETIKEVRSLGKRVVVIAPPPYGGFDSSRCLERLDNNLPVLGVDSGCAIDERTWRQARRVVLDFLSALSMQADVEVIHPSEYLCASGKCETEIDGIFIYRDSGHLSHEGSLLLVNKMNLVERFQTLAR